MHSNEISISYANRSALTRDYRFNTFRRGISCSGEQMQSVSMDIDEEFFAVATRRFQLCIIQLADKEKQDDEFEWFAMYRLYRTI